MSLHAKIWINRYDNVQMPVEPFAIIEVHLTDRGDRYRAGKVHLMTGGEYKFRLGVLNKTYERTRSIPYLIVAAIHQSDEGSDYEILERLSEIRTWKHMVHWRDVIDAVDYQVSQRWTVKIAGYDGPFTTG